MRGAVQSCQKKKNTWDHRENKTTNNVIYGIKSIFPT